MLNNFITNEEETCADRDVVLQKNSGNIPWTGFVSKVKILNKMETKSTLIFKMRNRDLKFLLLIMREHFLENFTLPEHIGAKTDRGSSEYTT